MRRGKRKEKKKKSSVTKFPSVFYKFFYIVVSISRFIVELERWFSLLYNHIVLQSTTFVPTFVGHETHFLKKKMPIAPLSTRTVGNKIKRDRSKRREREREREKYPERVKMQSIPWRLKARRTSFAQQRNHAKTPLRRSSISIGTELHTLLAPPPHFDYLRLSTCVPSLDGLTSYLLSLLFYMITIREYKCVWSHRFCVSFFPFFLSFFSCLVFNLPWIAADLLS